MADRFQFLQAGIRYVDPTGAFSTAFRVYWQQFVSALSDALTNIELNAELLAQAVEDIENVLILAGTAQLTADGALELAEAGLNPDGTVKTDKVTTESVQAGAISTADVELQVGSVFVTGTTETDLITNTLDTVPAGATGVQVTASAYVEDPDDNTVQCRFRLYRRPNSGASWTLVQQTYQRYDGTPLLVHFDGSAATGVQYKITYQRESEDFTISAGQIICLYLNR